MKKLMTLIAALMVVFAVNAQNWGQQRDSRQEFSPELYKKKLCEFVSREAQLTEAEACKFFPLLFEMQEKQHKLMGKQRELMVKGRRTPNLSEAEYANIVNTVTATDVEIRKVEQTYYKKFHSVLSWKKVYAVRQALNRFQMEALKMFQPGNQNPGQQRGGFRGPDMRGGGQGRR